MSMQEIALVTDIHDVRLVAALLQTAERTAAPLRFCVDDGALKVKVGQGTWSPPMGKLDPACEAAQSGCELHGLPANSGPCWCELPS